MRYLVVGLLLLGSLSVVAGESCVDKLKVLAMKGDNAGVIARARTCELNAPVYRAVGIAWYNEYRADSAIAYLSKSDSAGISDDTVLVGLAGAWLWKKDTKKANSVLLRAKNTQSIGYLGVKAMIHESLKEFDAAIALYDIIVKEYPQSWDAMAKKARVLAWQKKFAPAIDLYTMVMLSSTAPRALHIESMLRRAEVISWAKNLAGAQAALDSLIVKEPKSAAAWVIKGTINEWQGHFKEAKEAYAHALTIDPANTQAQLNIEKLLWVK